ILPSVRVEEVPLRVLTIIFRMLGRPAVIPARMVGDPIDHDPEPQLMGLGYEAFEIVHRAELGVSGSIVGAGIIAAEGTEAFGHADRGNGHEPEYVDPHVFQAGHLFGESVKGAFPGVLTNVHFIDIGRIDPVRRAKISTHIYKDTSLYL